jgi:hypothetical protein
MGGIFALYPLCPLADPTFLVPGVLVGDPRIQKRIYWGRTCHMGFGQRPGFLLLFMGGTLALRCHHPLMAPLFSCLGQFVGGLLLLLSFLLASWNIFIPPLTIGVAEAMGSYYRPPLGGGSASVAISPTVTCEVQGVSSLAAPPLTVVRALLLMVDLH